MIVVGEQIVGVASGCDLDVPPEQNWLSILSKLTGDKHANFCQFDMEANTGVSLGATATDSLPLLVVAKCN